MERKISPQSWMIVACGFLVLLVTNGMTLTGITMFDNALLSEFGWQRGALKLRDLITFAGAGFIAPLFGWLADKGHIRKCLLAGCLFLAAGFLVYSRISTIGGVYLAHALFGLSLASAGIVSVVFLVSSNVPASKRGLALGIALVGSSLGNSIFPQFNLALLNAFDWRTALVYLSAIPVLLMVMIALFLKVPHSTSNSNGATPENPGLDQNLAGKGSNAVDRHPSTSVFRSPAFWSIGIVAMLTFFSILGVTSHVFLRLTGAGYSPQFAGTALGMLFMMGLVGKLFSGAFADKFGVRLLMTLSLLLMSAGAFGLSQSVSLGVRAWILLFGLGWGALYTLIQMSIISTFGTKGSGRILGAVALLEALGGGLGPWIVGLLYDKTGSYQLGFGVVCAALLVALFASVSLKKSTLAQQQAAFGTN